MAGSHIAFAQELFSELKKINEEYRYSALKAICELYGTIAPSQQANEIPVRNQEQIEKIREKILDVIKGHIDDLIEKNYKEDTFYKKATNYIFNDKNLSCDEGRILALCRLLLDPRIPYFKYEEKDLCHMSEELFHKLMKELKRERQLIHHLKSRKFPERTMQASAILKILGIQKPEGDDVGDLAFSEYNKKVILMCEILYSTKY